MIRTLGVLALFTLLTSQAVASAVGLAQGKQPFTIDRGPDSLKALAETPTVVSTGDKLASTDGVVQVVTPGGETVLLAPKSKVAFDEQDKVVLQQGEVAMSVPPASGVTLTYNDLNITSMNPDGAEKGSRMVLKAVSPDEVIVAGFDDPITIHDQHNGVQVAVLGTSEAIRLVRNQLGSWQQLPFPKLPTMQDTGAPDTSNDESVDEQDNNDEAAGAFFLGMTGTTTAVVAGGGLVVLGGGAFAYNEYENNQNNNNNNNDNNNGSTFTRTPLTTRTDVQVFSDSTVY